jgi:hypothetical protein
MLLSQCIQLIMPTYCGFPSGFYLHAVNLSHGEIYLSILISLRKEMAKIGPSLYTKLVKNAKSKEDIGELIKGCKNRFGHIPWQLLAAAAYKSSTPDFN